MLASFPASMVNQKRADLGIPNRFSLISSRFSCPVLFEKIYCFVANPNQIHIPRRLVPQRGVSRSSRTRGGMRWTRAALLTRAHTCGRRSRVVLTPRRWRQIGGSNSTNDGDKKARSPRRARRKPLNPLRGECRVFPV